ncbi:MAG: excinuclease ABC subunit A, partial [Paludibacteraceae bacterium]|nr:excinuclease ABC subunit A [Paludibacteraceae bacterium]
KGARVNNLKQIDVQVPLGKLVVVTGVSGSGKSSLAFDTLYAEGQRRYVESLSSYARQFLGRMSKPEVDYIKNLPPAIAIEQKVKTRSSRSTVGTSTEIYDYLRRLFARVGKTISPVSGEQVKKHQVQDVLDYMAALPEGTWMLLLSPMNYRSALALKEGLEALRQQGFSRVLSNGEILRFDAFSDLPNPPLSFDLVIDRCASSREQAFLNRMADSVETAFYEGDGVCRVQLLDASKKIVGGKDFSVHFEADGIRFEEPVEALFSFNSPLGACSECEGFGSVIGIDEDLVIPNKALSVYEGAVVCWRGEKMGAYRQALILNAEKAGFPIHTPYWQLTDAQKDLLWNGCRHFEGIRDFFRFVESNQYKIQYRVLLSRYRGKTVCPKCRGARLRQEALYVQVGGKNIHELCSMTVSELIPFFEQLQLDQYERMAASKLLKEITNRLHYLDEVGLPYLTLDRASNTLSGGESQRINLATSLGSSLVGSLYVLDEPSIGLHSRDTQRLIGVLRKLQQLGNTIVVVEHDEQIMRAADWIIDIGPGAGRLGGQLVAQGAPADLLKSVRPDTPSATLRYLA